MPSTILSDNGVSSGSAGLKTTAASDGSLALQTTTAGGTATTAVTIDTSQNVGVGVTPSAWSLKALQVNGASIFGYTALNANIGANFYYDGSANKYIANGAAELLQLDAGTFKFFNAASGTAGNAISFTQAMTLNASGQLLVGATTDYGFGGKILTRGGGVVSSSSTWDNSSTGGAIAMFCDNANYGTIWALKNGNTAWGDVAIAPSGGNLLVGTTSRLFNDKFNVTTVNGTVGYSTFHNQNASAGNELSIVFARNSSTVGSITTSLTATGYNTSSDYRLKENIQPMTGALAKVAALKPVTYTWKADGSDGEGFIAHELAEVIPNAVTGEKDAVETYTDEDGNEQTRPKYQGIDTSFLVATLTAAIQELKAEFEAYKATHP
jgi:hypothetical protein